MSRMSTDSLPFHTLCHFQPSLSHSFHTPLCPHQVFQQLVELKESGRILNDLANGNTRRDHAFNEMREIMESWR